MGERTGISWTDATWNPWMGCTKVSPGCAYCYMFREQARYGNDPNVVRRSKTKFGEPLKWAAPRRIFTCSWSDWFHEAADEWRPEAWEIVRRTQQHTYLILTKRPERMADHLPLDWGNGYPNVWLGVSAENQVMADRRLPLLAATPAVVRFVSAEPLLGPLDLLPWLETIDRSDALLSDDPLAASLLQAAVYDGHADVRRLLDWVICGGESGSDRTMDIAWLEQVVRDCEDNGVAVFTKQDSGPVAGLKGRIADALWRHEFPTVVSR